MHTYKYTYICNFSITHKEYIDIYICILDIYICLYINIPNYQIYFKNADIGLMLTYNMSSLLTKLHICIYDLSILKIYLRTVHS